MRILNSAIIALTLTLSLWNCKGEGALTPLDKKALLIDMAEVDEALIPALYLTSINKPYSSLEALSKLKPAVDHFIQKYKNRNPKDSLWNRDIELLEIHLKYAEEHINGNLLKQANIQDLEPLSQTLVQMRARNVPDMYYPDLLQSLHSMAQSMASTLKGNIPEESFPIVLKSSQNLFKVIRQNFDTLRQIKLDTAIFSITPQKKTYLSSVLDETEKALVHIDSSVAGGDHEKIQGAYKALPKHFVEAYLVFGDFESLKKKK